MASLLDFHMLFHCFNVQSDRLWLPFWTSTCFSTALTSNLTDCGFLFGLPQAFPPLQRPIWQIETSLLDFHMLFHCSNVQSDRLWLPFWTSCMPPAALTSNLTDYGFPFGLPQAFPPLQRPIWQIETSLLDFHRLSLRFNVQSDRLWLPFWTSTGFPATLTSNLADCGFLFGLPHAFSPL